MSKKNRATDRASRAAAALAEQRRQESRRRNLMVGGVVVALVVIVLGGWLLARALDTTTDVTAPAAGSTYGVTLGPKSAPHTVVIYEDFLCPYCAAFEKATRADFTKLADAGKVRVEYRPFDFLSTAGDYSARSAEAFSIVLDKSGPDVAKKFHDLMFENQPSEQGPFPSNDDLLKLAVEAGADESVVGDAITNADGKGSWVTQATQKALDAGVRATPTVLLDGKVYQNGRTIDELASNLVSDVS